MEGTATVADKDQRVRGYCAYGPGKTCFETSVTTAISSVVCLPFAEANGISTKLGGGMDRRRHVFSSRYDRRASRAICAPSLGVIADRRMIKNLVAQDTHLARCNFMCSSCSLTVPRWRRWWIWASHRLHDGQRWVERCRGVLPRCCRTWATIRRWTPSQQSVCCGYLGGGLLLVVHLALVSGHSPGKGWVIPFAMATSGIWWQVRSNDVPLGA